MKSGLILFLLLAGFLVSCKSKNPKTVLSPQNLPVYSVTINSDSGYHLKSPNGALIKISANSFKVAPNTNIKIEIKEAYSIQDILLGGMTTQSDGKPLRSAGMFFFKASVDSIEAEFLKPVQVTMPAYVYDSSMQIFRSEIKDDSSINWINPRPMDTSAAVKNLLMGKNLFISKCASCHHPDRLLIGPPLAGVRDRAPNQEWLYRFVKNSSVMVTKDLYASRVWKKFNKIQMTSFPELAKPQIEAIFDYCDNEALLNPGRELDSNVTVDCGYDTLYYPKPKTDIEVSSFAENSSDNVDFNPGQFADTKPLNGDNGIPENEFTRKGFKYVSSPSGIYQFNITQSGWYNVDVLFGDPNSSKVRLFAKVEMQNAIDVDLFLCIPARKVMLKANMHKDDVYLFNYSDKEGYLTLIKNDDAFIIGVVSNEEKFYFGITPFKINQEQTISVKMKESTREEILSGIRDNNLDSFKLDIEKKEMEIKKRPCNEEFSMPVAGTKERSS